MPILRGRVRSFCRRGATASVLVPLAALSFGTTGRQPSVGASTSGGGSLPRCIVRLHGKGGQGAAPITKDGVAIFAPQGNAKGWGGRQWLYFPERNYAAARRLVTAVVTPCRHIILDGFSNGASFAAKLYCRGETFGGRLVGVVVDDPVVDAAVTPCTPGRGVRITLYWSGALAQTAKPGWSCGRADWTCEGGSTIGIAAYAAALGASPLRSPFRTHTWNLAAPELSQWWAGKA